MEGNTPGPSRGGVWPDWFLSWLQEVFLPVPLSSQIEIFTDAVEKLPDIEESVKQTLTSTFTNEAWVNLAREDDKQTISQLLKSQKLPAEKQAVQMPWTDLTESEMKIISHALESVHEQDFSAKALKHWCCYFEGLFDKYFITSGLGKLALAYNSCSLSLKQRFLALDAGVEARKESYSYFSLLQLINTLVHAPDSQDQAMMSIFKGMKQNSSETIQVFLQRWRDLGEDAYGPSSNWSMNQSSLMVQKICQGMLSSDISKMTSTIVVTLPFQWNSLVDSILQFNQRVQAQQPPQGVHAIQHRETKPPVCNKCGGNHMLRDCKVLFCKYCGGSHRNNACLLNGQPTFCTKCQSKFHNSDGHFRHMPSNKAPRRPDINLINSIEATSFVEGAISMDHKGKNFEETKLLIDTGALILSGIAVSEQFFIENLGGTLAS